MDLFTSHLTNGSPTNKLIQQTGAGDKLKKLQITKKENTNSYRSTSSLQQSQQQQLQSNQKTDYEEILITIRKSEKGFGFELKNGILIVRVLPSTPAFNSGIKVGDLILKVNGTCVRSKDANEITNMIHESNSFVSLALQRKIKEHTIQSDTEQSEDLNKLKNVTNQLNNSKNSIDLDQCENQILNELSESCREDNENHSLDDLDTDFKQHRKQQSVTDDCFEETNDVQRREIKKSLSTNNSKSYQTKSLSNIVHKPMLAHSTSDNELDQAKRTRNTLNEADFSIPYKDDLQTMDLDDHDKQWDLSSFSNYTQLCLKPINIAYFLNYLLSSSDNSPKNLYFCLFSEELNNSTEKKETILRWAYELYSTFITQQSPLKIKLNDSIIQKFDDYFDHPDQPVQQLKKLFEDTRLEIIEIVNLQLNKFREVNQMGLGSLFSQSLVKDSDLIQSLFNTYLQELNKIDLNRLANDWNDSRVQEAHQSALISSFATYLKRFNIQIKQIAKFELDKIPIYLNRKFKPKKQPTNSLRNHNFIEYLSSTSKSLCYKCKLPFWGIGNQGLICQKVKCELKYHRNCLQHCTECQGSQKNIRSDYKEKLDSFQKILFGSKKKDDDNQSSFFITGFAGSTDSQLNQKKEYERQASIISSNLSQQSSLDDHNLPVELAIKRFESLVNKPQVSIQSGPKVRLSSEQSPETSTSDLFSPKLTHHKHKLKRNSNLKGKDQACKRVGSLKTDVKKVKTHINRSKSDPHPDEIKTAITTDINKSNRFSIDLTQSMDQNESVLSQINSPKQQSILIKKNSINSRNSWMNDSDMEVDEELPNISVNIEREKFEKLTKKEVKAQEVINELIHTEQKHVRNLKIIKNHFYVPIKVEILLTEEERNLLFPNLDEILDLHSNFNEKLKKLRKEYKIVPTSNLIDIIQEQFEGENGDKFQSACAQFCQNQSEAMKFLQLKSKIATDKFTTFLAKSENDSICRKLHLKDFLPKEVQRLVKYRLLFQELAKNTSEEDNKTRLLGCIDASSKISLYVNKAVTECENKKRVIEIQSKLDTKEFDQYCVRSPVLSPYRNLQLIARKLIYEGELEWKLSNIKLTALLFEDILVFLEMFKPDAQNDEKRRYILRPLIYIIGKTKQMFTPVIPLSCINSFRSMHDKRSFHLVAIIEDSAKLAKHSTMSSSKPIQAQMLFILNAKSGDERNKWTQHLQELTGKMMQSVGHELQSTNVQDLSANKLTTQITNTISATNLMTQTQSTIRNNSVSSSALITTRNEFLNLDSNKQDITTQLDKNTIDLVNLLKTRHELLAKISTMDSKQEFSSTDSSNSKSLINNSLDLLNQLTTNLITTDLNSQQAKSVQIIIKLEECLNEIKRNETTVNLPDLKLNMLDKKPSIGSNISRVNRDLIDSVADAVSTTTTSELTADLSEDEQINYYDECEYNSSNDNINDNEKFETNMNQSRRFSDSSNKTLCVLTPSVNKFKNKHINIDADDEDDLDSVNNNSKTTKLSDVNSENENDNFNKFNQNNNNCNKLTCSQSSSDLNDNCKKQSTLKYSGTFDGGEGRKSFRSSSELFKTIANIEPNQGASPSSSLNKSTSNHSTPMKSNIKQLIVDNNDCNDSSDDEIKDYLTLKDNFDEISHA